MDVVCLQLPHHVRLCYRPVYVAYHYLLVLVPEEYLELGLFHLSRPQLQTEFCPVLSHLQLHLAEHFGVGDLAVPDDLGFLKASGQLKGRPLLLLNIELGHILIPPKDREPTFLGFCLDNGVNKFGGRLLPEGKFAGQNSNPQLPGVKTVVYPHH